MTVARRNERGEPQRAGAAVVLVPRADLAPLTLQQDIWVKRFLKGHVRSRLDPFLLHIRGNLNVKAMQHSLGELVRRHGSLRTRITEVEGDASQWIDEPHEQCLEVLDLTALAESEIHLQLKRAIEDLCNDGCDLAVGPLFAVRLFKLAEQEHVFVVAIHHIIYDGLTVTLLFRELWSCYRAVVAGQSPPAIVAPVQSADYARWQRTMGGVWTQRHRWYWLEHLAGAAAIRWPNIGTRQSRVPRFDSVRLSVGASLTNGLRGAARQARTLPAVVLLAIYAAAVSRQCGQRDFVITTTVHGRDLPGHENLVGYCSHSIYLRVQLRGDERFCDLLHHVSDEFYRAMEHKDFGGIVEEFPQLRAGTLFQWFPWPSEMGVPAPEMDLGLEVKPFELPFKLKWHADMPDIYDMLPLCSNTKDGILLSVLYRPEILSAAAMTQLVADFRATAGRLVQNVYDRAVVDGHH